MKMIKVLMIVLPMILLINGCKRRIICTELRRNAIKAVPWCDISFGKISRCRCRCFNLGTYKTVNDSECNKEDKKFHSGNYPVQECDGIAGAMLKDYNLELKPKIKRFNKIKNNYCKRY